MTDLYSNYTSRVTAPKYQRFVRSWHQKLVEHVLTQKPDCRSWLEVGPGHGYVAEIVTLRDISYSFIDNSPSVYRAMTSNGHRGHLGTHNVLDTQQNSFDVIYLSHVLEHLPTWVAARELLASCAKSLADKGVLVIVSPDILSWKHEFWNVDPTHGFPTSLRNVIQLLEDVGLSVETAFHHRNGSNNRFVRAFFKMLSAIPHQFVDLIVANERLVRGDGPMYSWKAVFGWRQIFVVAQKTG